MDKLASYIDHTLLAPTASRADIDRLCREAVSLGFFAVCINSRFVRQARKLLEGSGVAIAVVVGFPLGASASEAKVCETIHACREGASEIDMVISIGALKEGADEEVLADMRAVIDAAASFGARVKVILETCLLTDEEIVKGCQLAREAGAAFVKTSTGFSREGAREEHVRLMKEAAGPQVQVKAAGGIRDRQTAERMIAAGADRIGTSSGPAILKNNK